MCQTSFFRFIVRAALAVKLATSLSFALPHVFAARGTQPSADRGPRITSLLPNPVPLDQEVTLTVRGTGFTGDSKVVWNGLRLDDTKLSADKQVLTATVRANQISQAGSAKVSVTDPTGTSQTLQVMIGNGDGQRWRATSGIGGGHITTLLATRTQLYAGTLDSGVFRGNLDGKDWRPMNKGLRTLSIRALAATKDRAALLAATDSSIFRLGRGSDTWEQLHVMMGESEVTAFTCLLVTETEISAGSAEAGVFVSMDSGQSWTANNKGLPQSNQALKVKALAVSRSYYVLGTEGGVFIYGAKTNGWSAVSLGTVPPGGAQPGETCHDGGVRHPAGRAPRDGATPGAAGDQLPAR